MPHFARPSMVVDKRRRGGRPVVLPVALLVTFALIAVLGLGGTAAAQVFSDLGGSPYGEAIEGMAAFHIIDGYPQGDGTALFKPDNPVWRAQFAKMIDGVMQLQPTEDLTSPFTDLGNDDPNSLYPHEYVAAAYAAGITNGTTATTFGPYVDIKRAQVVTMIVRALQNLKPGALADPPAGYHSAVGSFDTTHSPNMDVAEYNGLLNGLLGYGSSWDPYAKASRGEVAQMLWNILSPATQPGIMPPIDQLQPAIAAYALDLTLGGTISFEGVPGPPLSLDVTPISAQVTVEILGFEAGLASFSVTIEQTEMDGQPAGGGALVVTFDMNTQGEIVSMEVDGKPMAPDDLAGVSAAFSHIFGAFLAPLRVSLHDVGDEWQGGSTYELQDGDGEISSQTSITLAALDEVGSRRIATVDFMTDSTIDALFDFDLAPLLEGMTITPLAVGPATEMIAVFSVDGTMYEEGSLQIDTATGLPVASAGDFDLSLDIDIVQLPAELGDLIDLDQLLTLGTIGLDLHGTFDLQELP